MSDFTHDVSLAPKANRLNRIWPRAVNGISLSATVVWTCILGYGFIRLIELLI
jgi:hypothetical protein